MTLPEGVQPSGPSEPATDSTVTEAPVVTEPATTDPTTTVDAPAFSDATVEEPAPVDDPDTAVNEAASDAELRAWAKDNGIEDVPASGRLSATWRDQIVAAMAAALDPKDEASVEPSSPESSPTPETMTETTLEEPSSGESPSASTEEAPAEKPLTGPGSDQPEFSHGGTEYRSVFQAPNTFMTGQNFTA